MQYAPTLTDQKFNPLLFIDLPAGYVRGRMQYAPTHTDKKLDGLLADDSSAGYARVRI